MEFLDNDYSFQIFMTSHSPILVSHANLESLIILEDINNEEEYDAAADAYEERLDARAWSESMK